MQEVIRDNWNPRKMCHMISCSSDLTHFEYVKINGMEIVVCKILDDGMSLITTIEVNGKNQIMKTINQLWTKYNVD